VTGGFRGVVYPVQERLEAVLGIHCYPDARRLPRSPDLAVVCAAAARVPGIVRECGEAGILGIVIVSAGFREIGAAGHALEEEIRATSRRFDGMRIIGPNCLGIIVPGLSLNASFATGMPKRARACVASGTVHLGSRLP
jgi:acetyltransferase